MPISAFSDVSGGLFLIDSTKAYTDAGVTQASSNGAVIQQLTDQFGNGNHWINTGASGSRPTYIASDDHLGVGTVAFDGAIPQTLTMPDLSALTTATFFWVLRANSDSGHLEQKSGFHTMGTQSTYYPHPNANIYDCAGSNNRTNIDPRRPLTQWTLYHAVTSASTISIGADRTFDGAVISTTAVSFGTPIFGKNLSNNGFDGRFRLCVAYNRVLTDNEHSDVGRLIQDTIIGSELYWHVIKILKPDPTYTLLGGTLNQTICLHPIGDTGRPDTSGTSGGGQLYPRGDGVPG